jgi:flagellar hook-associated protein 3 FlgL
VGLNVADGIVLSNGEQSVTVDLSTAETVQDVLNAINNAGLYARAEINADGTGINVVNELSGPRCRSARTAALAATLLGIRSFHGGSTLANSTTDKAFARSKARPTCASPPRTAVTSTSNLDGVGTINEVLTAINDAATAAGRKCHRGSRGHGQRHPPE